MYDYYLGGKDNFRIDREAAEKAMSNNEAERKQELQRLSREQKQLQEEAERFARRLQRLQAENASRSAMKVCVAG